MNLLVTQRGLSLTETCWWSTRPPPSSPMVLRHRKMGVAQRDAWRRMENGMDGRRGRDAERVMITSLVPQPPPTQTRKWAYPWRALPRLPRSPLCKWNPHLNTRDDIWIHLSASTLMGRRGNGGRPFCGAESAAHLQINISFSVIVGK